jgi:hypothetical protein
MPGSKKEEKEEEEEEEEGKEEEEAAAMTQSTGSPYAIFITSSASEECNEHH